MTFVHLHNHTQYSVLDGACRIEDMVALAVEMGMPAVAMTDHGNMYGTIDFVKNATAKGIKPIVGIEAYLVEHDYDHPFTKDDERYHLVLLVKNAIGYKNLMKISSISFIEGHYYKPRICKSLLAKHSEGLICLSACVQGELPKKILNSREDALQALQFYKDTFGDDFYIEIQDHGLDDEKRAMPKLIELAKETNTPLVVTNDCHYLRQEDSEAHNVLLCVQTNKMVNDPSRMSYPNNMFFKSPQQMRALFPEHPEAADNTLKIAEKIDFKLAYDNLLIPKVSLPEGFATETEFIRNLCFTAAKTKYPDTPPEVTERIIYELQVISKMGFDGYFLIVKDLIDYAKSQDVPVGPGRGSAVGSIVSYLLGITKLDPLKYGLLFERFLNPERISMPDIDIDFCRIGRQKIIDYVVEKYGRNSVAQIVTFGTLAAKSAIKDVARVMEIPPVEANNLTKLMPNPEQSGQQLTLAESIRSTEFSTAIYANPVYSEIYQKACFIEGLIRQTGIHAAGVVIVPGDLSDYVPLATNQKSENEDVILVQYEGKWLEELKLLKMDFLGLNNLSVIHKALELIKQYKDVDIDIDNIDLNDKKTYDLLSKGQTEGVFQFESDGMTKYLREMKPNQLSDLIAMVALYRPGPMQFIDTFIARKHGREPIVYEHPLLEATLKETYGVTVYQEQVMQISRDVGGLTGPEADSLRKAMGKKNVAYMEKLKEKFQEGATRNGLTAGQINSIWSTWLKFAEYAFNKSHAACYALLAYQTAYLKVNYPVEYMTALLSLEENPKKVPGFLAAVVKMGIHIDPPTINTSQNDFTIKDNRILFGLSALKNIGYAAISAIITEREKNGIFTNFYEFVERVEANAMNKSALEALIVAGTLDKLPGTRAQKHKAMENALYRASTNQKSKNSPQATLFDFMTDDERGDEIPNLPVVEDWDEKTRLEKEKEVLGFYVSGHPLSKYEYVMRFYTNTYSKDVESEHKLPDRIRILGQVVSRSYKKDRSGNDFVIITLEDLYGTFEITLFNKDYDRYRSYAEVGLMLYVVGQQSLYQGNNSENILRIKIEKIMLAEDVAKKVSGEIIIKLNETDANQELATFLDTYNKNNHGRFKVGFLVKTLSGHNVNLKTNKYALLPSDELYSELCDKRGLVYNCRWGDDN